MRTLFIIKPDAVERLAIGQILMRIEAAGFEIKDLKMLRAYRTVVSEHYHEHKDKEFFRGLVGSMADRQVVVGTASYTAGVEKRVAAFRTLIGPYRERVVGTLRGDFAISKLYNAIHGSADDDAAERETRLWFP